MPFIPSYIELFNSGELARRAGQAIRYLDRCTCCPRNCMTDRSAGSHSPLKSGCHSGYLPSVSSYTPHFGEEPVLSGNRGTGNIFFSSCNLRCIFCQNYQISQDKHLAEESQVSFERLAGMMIDLQSAGCHNIGLVSPSHFSAQILTSLNIAASKGLRLPVIYNSNGYDSVEMLKLYEGVADIYLPDLKYGDSGAGRSYSHVAHYFESAKAALLEMYRQVGSTVLYEDGLMVRGLIVRHLVLPNDLAESEEVFRFIARELSPDVHISLMSQYYPAHRASEEMLLSRKLRESEYQRTVELLDKYGLKNGWIQEPESQDYYRPDFLSNRDNPFGN